jgi:hypothetical protein
VGLLATSAATLYAAHRTLLGAFDYTVINREGRFIALALTAALASAAVSFGLHARFVGDRARLVRDGLTATALLFAANAAHIAVYGWPLGFPLPPPPMRYAPFFGSISLVAYAAATLAAVIVRSRARERASRS